MADIAALERDAVFCIEQAELLEEQIAEARRELRRTRRQLKTIGRSRRSSEIRKAVNDAIKSQRKRQDGMYIVARRLRLRSMVIRGALLATYGRIPRTPSPPRAPPSPTYAGITLIPDVMGYASYPTRGWA